MNFSLPFFADKVKVTSTSTGTGNIALGSAVAGFQDFSTIAVNSPWDISTVSFVQSVNVTSQMVSNNRVDTTLQGMFFRDDGAKMYTVGGSSVAGRSIYEFNLSLPWNISTASNVQSFNIATQTPTITTPRNVVFKDDGTKMFLLDSGTVDSVHEYTLSTAWDISTASNTGSLSITSRENAPYAMFFKPDGTKMYVAGTSSQAINEFNLSVAWQISSATYSQRYVTSTQSGLSDPARLFFKSDGTKMYVGKTDGEIWQYSLSTAWDVSTSNLEKRFSYTQLSTAGGATGLFFGLNGTKMYVCGTILYTMFEFDLGLTRTHYCITNGTDWEMGMGSCSYSGTYLRRDTVYESSNNNSLVNWGGGNKEVFVTFPVEATEGTVPESETGQIGTDLVAWRNLKKELERTALNGQLFNNKNSHFGIIYTYVNPEPLVADAYVGGVLAPNGDIHFVPSSAKKGLKINWKTKNVTVYSLIWTTNSTAYGGGVLAPNGDIHFIPQAAPVGTKVTQDGVVSTYSLVYTTVNAYSGGVVNPNGEIHYIPTNAPVGQKISVNGVVSTYSLVYTTTSGAYSGGVLAPNGDIHFVPSDARVGQKISAAGVVSTYSLVYTRSNAYGGGVLAPNGDIYFVPNTARVGQKVSIDGVVSTYALARTATSTLHRGGILLPNGDIFFNQETFAAHVNYINGIITTSSLPFNISRSGVLAPDGDVYTTVTESGTGYKRPAKYPTGVQRGPGFCLSPFFNKSY